MFRKLFAKKQERLQSGCLSMPLLKGLESVSGPAIAELTSTLFPSIRTVFEDDSAEESKAVLSFRSDDSIVFAALMDLPIPGDEVVVNARRSFLWPDAESRVEHHAHVVLIGQGPSYGILNQYWACTRIAAAIMSLPEAVGWYIGNAGVVHEPKQVVDTAASAAAEGSLPLTLWISIAVSVDGPGLCSASTIGMNAFGRPEFEIALSSWEAAELYGLLYDVAHYVLSTGAEFRHGQTFGRSKHDRMPVEVGKSKLGKDGTVVRLVVP